ncbi:TPA: hypothetical protein DCS99_01490 [Candidatus Wolfebacteria bacterium]|nr:hypothetical protein [Candidatus Wolfebacteria bacterium]
MAGVEDQTRRTETGDRFPVPNEGVGERPVLPQGRLADEGELPEERCLAILEAFGDRQPALGGCKGVPGDVMRAGAFDVAPLLAACINQVVPLRLEIVEECKDGRAFRCADDLFSGKRRRIGCLGRATRYLPRERRDAVEGGESELQRYYRELSPFGSCHATPPGVWL